MPRKRDWSKNEIIEELLTNATELANIDLVIMDREFDTADVKETCERYDVHYLTPTRIFDRSDETETIAWMYREGQRFHVTEEKTDDDTPTCKQLYLPKRSCSDDEEAEKRKQKAKDGGVGTAGTVVFKMNHPYVTVQKLI